MKPAVRAKGLTLIELLVVLAIIGLLAGITLPALQGARQRAKLVVCASNLRQIGCAAVNYAGEYRDQLPLNHHLWTSTYSTTFGMEIVPGYLDTWVSRLQYSMGIDSDPWLRPLRCPLAQEQFPEHLSDMPVPSGDPGSAWYLNSYCSGRMLGSIPRPADGVLVFESGVWTRMANDTGCLEMPTNPWCYPHPRVTFDTDIVPWRWDYRGRRRNIVWCDGHVDARSAHTWPNGAYGQDPDRIRHMRFGLAGTNWLDP